MSIINYINNNSNINNEIKEAINEEVLYNSLCFLPFEILLDSLISIGYENDIDLIGNSKTAVLNRLVNDCRELGIEEFIQRLDFQTLTETCSLLSLSGVNGDTDNEILLKSRQQLEDKMKKESLDQFLFPLTPHILSKFCHCLKIILPPPTTNNNNNHHTTNNTVSDDDEEDNNNINGEDNNDNDEDEDDGDISPSTSTTPTTIINSIPSIKVGLDGTTVLSTLSTKSSYKKLKKNRGIQYGDNIVEGIFHKEIIKVIKEEILVCGVEHLFSFHGKPKLLAICDHLKITLKPSDKMSDIITKIISKLFNIDNTYNQQPPQPIQPQSEQQQPLNIDDLSHTNEKTTTTTSTTNNKQKSKKVKLSNTTNEIKTPITRKSKLEYPKTPLSDDEQEEQQEEDEEEEDEQKEQQQQEVETASQEEEEEEEQPIKEKKTSKNKRKFEQVEVENQSTPVATETDDSEIDRPAKRPSVIDIKMGIKKQDLELYLAKDLRSWLQKKGLKYNDKKSILVNRVLKFLENEAEGTSASESEISSSGGKRVVKRLRKQSSSTNTTASTTKTNNTTPTKVE